MSPFFVFLCRPYVLYPCNGVYKVNGEETDLSDYCKAFTAKRFVRWTNSTKRVRWTNSTVDTIRRTVVTRDKCVILSLYKSLLMPRVGIGLLGTGMKSLLNRVLGNWR